MTATLSRLQAVLYETESSWAESTSTFGTRLQHLNVIDMQGLTQDRIPVPFTQQYAEEGIAGIRGPYGGQFTIELLLTGVGSAPTSTITATDLYTVLANALGGSANATGTDVATATDADSITLTAAPDPGEMFRIGADGDSRGDGQWTVFDSTSELFVALPATPNAADVAYGSLMVFPSESTAFSDITSTRWRFITGNGNWDAHGCFPTGIEFPSLNVGEPTPRVRITYGVSRWTTGSTVLPSATAADAKTGLMIADSTVFINDQGTTTRATYSVRDFSLSIDLQAQPLFGPDSGNTYQTIVGARRTRCAATFSLTFDREAAGTTTWDTNFTNGDIQHVLVGLSNVAGQALAFYAPRAEILNYPTMMDMDGLNRTTVNFRCLTDTTGANVGEMSSFRIAMG